MKIQKKVLREIYDISSIISQIENAFANDRSSERATNIFDLVKEGKEKCQRLIDSEDPLRW